ncbi:MAG: hypothetical protein J7621_23355 [Niastella sp.]|nr:hypothetical protein [Niastella sp.]
MEPTNNQSQTEQSQRQSERCNPCIIPGFVPAPMAEYKEQKQQVAAALQAHREGKAVLTVVPMDATPDETGAKVISLLPATDQQA